MVKSLAAVTRTTSVLEKTCGSLPSDSANRLRLSAAKDCIVIDVVRAAITGEKRGTPRTLESSCQVTEIRVMDISAESAAFRFTQSIASLPTLQRVGFVAH